MRISIQLEPQAGMNWALWKRYVPLLEEMGFDEIYRSDHFTMGVPPVDDALELMVSLAYLADHTERVSFGSLVAPFSFRDPVMLVRQAMAINDLSGGRMILGVGAGWHEGEHRAFGYDLGDKKTRMDRLEEGLAVVAGLARSTEPVSYQGRFYGLDEARILPRGEKPLRILVGGSGPKRTLPLAARYADIWNCHPRSPEAFRESSRRLDELVAAEGRKPKDVRRTAMIPALAWRNPQELDRIVEAARRVPSNANTDVEELRRIYSSMGGTTGSPQQVVDAMGQYAEAGVETFVLQWFNTHDFEGLDLLAQEVLPHFMR